MYSKAEISAYNRTRRENLIAAGLCCDCGANPVRKLPPGPVQGRRRRKPVLCEKCAGERRNRFARSTVPPLIRLMDRAT